MSGKLIVDWRPRSGSRILLKTCLNICGHAIGKDRYSPVDPHVRSRTDTAHDSGSNEDELFTNGVPCRFGLSIELALICTFLFWGTEDVQLDLGQLRGLRCP